MSEFVPLVFPSWIRWGQRRGAFVDNAALAAVYSDHKHIVSIREENAARLAEIDEQLKTSWQSPAWESLHAERRRLSVKTVGSVHRCGWCGNVCTGRRSSWCSDKCSEQFYRVWSWGAVATYITERDHETCRRCGSTNPGTTISRRSGSERPRAWEVDHITPVVDGGTDDPANLRLLCHDCHVAVGYEQRAARKGQTLIALSA